MTIKMSTELSEALHSDCARSFEAVLTRKNPDDFKALIDITQDEASPAALRSTALFILGGWGDTKAVEAIASVLPKLSEAEQVSALDALGRLGTPAALQAIRDCVHAESADVRKFAVHALGRIGSPEALAALQEIEQRDPTAYVRKAADRYLHRTP